MKKCLTGTAAMLVFVFIASISGCDAKPIQIGFVGGLTGKMADLGIAGRNGVQLAVEEINRAGGIDGRPVELIVKNDRQDEEAARQAVEELINDDVIAIVGHMTSSMSEAVIPIINQHKTVMISPTSSSGRLSGLDDYFFRIVAPNDRETEVLAKYTAETLAVRTISAIADLANSVFTLGWIENFEKHFNAAGGELLKTVEFDSSAGPDHLKIAARALLPEPNGIIVVANAFDTAQFCQQIKKYSPETTVIPSGWAMTKELIRQGGKSVEGLVFAQIVDLESKDPRFTAFKKAYIDHFGMEPDFAAVHGYTAVQGLKRAIEGTPKNGSLKETILAQKVYNGLQSSIEFDKYGDPHRQYFMFTVDAGEFVHREE